MALTADSLLERIRLKSQLNRWRIFTILAVATLVLLLISPQKDVSSGFTLGGKVIARAEISDIILNDKDRNEIIHQIAENEKVAALILHIDSPGGSIVGGETLYHSLKALAKEKPLVVVMGSLAASGGYMAALPAERIFAHEGTLTGSIGVVMQTAEFTELAQKLGVTFLTFKSGDLKASPSPFEKLPQSARQAIESSIQSGFDMFVRMVMESRKMNESLVRRLSDGRIYTGSQAVEHGLVDAIGGEKEALEWLHKKYPAMQKLPVKDFLLKPRKGAFEELYAKVLAGGNSLTSLLTTQGLMVLWQPGV
jgi:protease-4